MGLTIADTYYLKAKGAIGTFLSDWSEASESLNYALSYDENHCPSLCLMGEVLARYLVDYQQAFACFDKVIANDSGYTEVYYPYAKYLIWAGEIERAKKLVTFAFTVKGIGKASMYWLTSYIEETEEKYGESLKALKKGKKYAFNDYYFNFLQEEICRIKKKMKLGKLKSKKKKRKPSLKKGSGKKKK